MNRLAFHQRGSCQVSETNAGRTQLIPVDYLLLDDTNPRLPERLRERSQSELLRFFYDEGVLEELAQSFVDNGFFQHEPLIVVPTEQDERYVVVEGNRRLAALKVLHQVPLADELHFVSVDARSEELQILREIPCFIIRDRNAVHAYIGFRHIGALKTWPPEAKARYLLAEARRLEADTGRDPFRDLGRRVGSNAQGVRNPYIAIRILLHAREEFGLEVTYVQDRRFGVWLRCMNSADIRTYIGFGSATTYDEIEEALGRVKEKKLKEVLNDLRGDGTTRRAVLGDSRDVTVYGRALMDSRAHETLRQTNDLALAKQIVEEAGLDVRAQQLAQSIKIFVETLQRAENVDISADLLSATDDLFYFARSARAIVHSLGSGENEP